MSAPLAWRNKKAKNCLACGVWYTPKRETPPICSDECLDRRKTERRKVVVLPCVICGAPSPCSGKAGLTRARRGRAFCSDTCKDLFVSAANSATASSTNRRHASERMRRRNPMRNPAALERMRRALAGRTFIARGGNGQPTEPQVLMASALGLPMEFPICTAPVAGFFPSLPHAYKVDLACPDVRLAIEIDGRSHSTKKWKFLDARKTSVLTALGWTVLRFTNRQVMEDLAGCARTVTSTISRLKETTTISRMAS